MNHNAIVFETVRPWLDSKGFNPPRIAALDAALERYLSAHIGEPIVVTAPVPPKPQGRRASAEAVALMHEFESCRLKAYPDPGSKDGKPWTIGWGSTGPDIGPGTVWTQEQADERFRRDLARFEDGVSRLIGSAPTSQCQFDALVSIAYNIGLDEDADTIAEGLGDSSLLRHHKAGDYARAAAAFASWKFNDGQVMKGLVRRRSCEALLYQGKDWRAAL